MSERATRNENDKNTRSPDSKNQNENTRSEKDRPSLSVEALEPRILLSASWIDADTGDAIPGATEGDDIFDGSNQGDIKDGLGGNDIMHGNQGSDQLFGGEGDDQLYGDQGRDILVSGGGNDFLDGGVGGDTFRFDGAKDGDVITVDGGQGTDTIDLSNYSDEQITDDGSTITVDMGNDESFTINYTEVENIITGGPGNTGPTDDEPTAPEIPDTEGPVDTVPTGTDEVPPSMMPADTEGPGETRWDGSEDLEVLDPRTEMVSRVEFLNNLEREEVPDLEPPGSAQIESEYDVTGEVTLESNAASVDDSSPNAEFDAGGLGFESFFDPSEASRSSSEPGADEPTRDRDTEPQAEGNVPPGEAHVEAGVTPNFVEQPLALSDNPEPVGFFARLWGVLRGTVATSRRMDESVVAEERNKASSQR